MAFKKAGVTANGMNREVQVSPGDGSPHRHNDSVRPESVTHYSHLIGTLALSWYCRGRH